MVPANVQFKGKIRMTQTDWMNELNEPSFGVCVARSILPRRGTGIPIRLINTNNHAISLTKGTPLAYMEPVMVDSYSDGSTNIYRKYLICHMLTRKT